MTELEGISISIEDLRVKSNQIISNLHKVFIRHIIDISMATSNFSLNTSSFLTPWTIFLIALIIVVGAIIILTIIEKRLNRKILKKKMEEENSFQKRINALKQMPLKPEKLLNSIDNIGREFFEKKYKTNRNSKYSNLIEFFEKNKDTVAMKFCERMQESLYGGEKLAPQKVNFLLSNLDFLINSEKRPEVKPIEEKNIKKVSLSKILNQARKNPEKSNINNKNVQKIRDYLSDGLNREFSINFLKQKLTEAGFNEEDILEAVSRLEVSEKNLVILPLEEEDISQLKNRNIVPYNKEEIKLNKTKNIENPNVNKFINGPGNLDRLVYKIEKKRKFLPSTQEFSLV